MHGVATEFGSMAGGGLVELARGLLQQEASVTDMVPSAIPTRAASPSIVLSLDDILTDEGGACVLDGDGTCLSILLETDDPVVAQGQSEAVATAAGADVSGHAFIAFASGVTVYFPAEIEVAIAAPGS